MSGADAPGQLLLLGGTPRARGGVEVFSERAVAALRESGIVVRHLPTQSAFLGARTLPSFLSALVRAGKAALRDRQVWLQYGNVADLFYLPLGLLPGVHLVVTPHLGTNWRSQSSSILRLLARAALSQADALALISPTQEQELDLPSGPRRFLIPTFLPGALADIVASQPAAGSDAPLKLVHAGRLSQGKGTLLVLEITRQLIARGVDLRLELIGSPDPVAAAAIEAARADATICDHINFVGHVDEAALLRRLADADILLHLSEVDSFPLIVLEAIGCGAYPICLSLPGASMMIERYTGSVIQAHNPVRDAVEIIASFDRAEQRARSDEAAAAVRSDYSGPTAASAIAAIALPRHSAAG